MRCACLVHAMMRIEKPVTVLFDDYGARTLYRDVERVVTPAEMIGTMARFELKPDMLSKKDLSFAIRQFFVGSIHGCGEKYYEAGNPA
ncbi:hypothetical protein DXV76_04290 [Rhodobacteraceae bacterium CCMM004]|nr:hypothetical protein DXV76_04290 [Rhodobacteraceae bacterium CCMM004]